jgi:DNA invertase Pin-like site-specific DNA recombinase
METSSKVRGGCGEIGEHRGRTSLVENGVDTQEDDGISGAEFAKRPGLVRLINALTPRPPFQVLVMSEESRLGREQIETAYLLKQLITAGVRVVYYLEDRERTLDSPTEKLLRSVSTSPRSRPRTLRHGILLMPSVEGRIR